MKQNEAKLLFRGHCPFHACQRFIEALVPGAPLDHYGLGLTKPATFLRLRSPATKEHAVTYTRRFSCCKPWFYSATSYICTPGAVCI